MNKVSIFGGLGNQMFQFAFYLALKSRNIKTRISISDFLYYSPHNGFELYRAFRIPLSFPNSLNNFILENFKWMLNSRVVYGINRRLIPFFHKIVYAKYEETLSFQFDENALIQNDRFFVGIWQSNLYFKNIESAVRQSFKFNIKKNEVDEVLLSRIRTGNSVSVHIRRGDYLKSPWNEILVNLTSGNYYKLALSYLNSKIEHPHFYIFSDDITWTKENTSFPNSTFIDSNRYKNSHIDMFLMSQCRHNIIANSTFSWWGAWLNDNPEKIVIMPGVWFKSQTVEGLIPSDWTLINLEEK